LFYLGLLKIELPKEPFFIFVKFGKLIENYHLHLLSKPLESDIFCLENIDF
jgi:hypothetical protein